MGYLMTIKPIVLKFPRFSGKEYECFGNLECDALQLGTRLSHYTGWHTGKR